jgi:hypothetical protein
MRLESRKLLQDVLTALELLEEFVGVRTLAE